MADKKSLYTRMQSYSPFVRIGNKKILVSFGGPSSTTAVVVGFSGGGAGIGVVSEVGGGGGAGGGVVFGLQQISMQLWKVSYESISA